jgi:Tol biopolymer transport system component
MSAGVAAGFGVALYFMVPKAATRAGNGADDSRLWRLTSLGSLESEPTWSPDGKFIAYSSDRSGNDDIWLQSTTDNSEAVHLTSGPGREWQPAWSPDGGRIAYRSEDAGGQIVVKSLVGRGRTTAIPGGYLPRWSPDGTRLLVSGSNVRVGGSSRIVDATSGATISEIRHGQFREARVQWSPKGDRLSLYGVHVEHGRGFWMLSADGRVLERVAIDHEVTSRMERIRLQVRDFVWAPDARRIYITGRADDSENIWAIDVDPSTMAWIGGPDRLTTGAGREQHVAVSRDGRKIAFTNAVRTTQAWAFPFDAAEGRILGGGEPLTPSGADADVLDLAPDGRLVYRTTRRNNDELWLTSGRDLTLLATEFSGRIVQPRWSHDGRQIAYFRASGASDSRIVVLDAYEGRSRQLVQPASATNNLFEWTADGSGAIVGCREQPGRPAGICLASLRTDARTSSKVLATHDSQSLYQARLSPDGNWISFIGTADAQRSTIYVMPKDGGPWSPITDGRHFDDKPRWAPQGGILYYLSQREGFWNVWGRQVDLRTGRPAGEPFQVSQFYSAARRIHYHNTIQIGVSARQLVLPLTETTGAVWILENFR